MKTTPRSQLLLVELVCDLVIFAICAVVCVALLVQARIMIRESTQLTNAVYIAQTAAETYLAGGELAYGYSAEGQEVLDPTSALFPEFLTSVETQADGSVLLVVYLYGQSPQQPVYSLTMKGGA